MPRPEATREEWAAATEHARRLARFKHAMDRCRKMAEGSPAFTEKELRQLAGVFEPPEATDGDGTPRFSRKEIGDLAGIFAAPGAGGEDAA